MAYDGWLSYGGVELANLSRTAQLAEAMGIDTVWTDPATVQWIEDALTGGVGDDYDLVEAAPWYDAGVPASAEFAGVVVLSLPGLDDSTKESGTVEYITDGGASTGLRSKTLPLVANFGLVASTERGADFGKRWLDRVLAGNPDRMFCSGSDLRYFQYRQEAGLGVPPIKHRRNVSITRGTSITRKRYTHCSALWLVTFTLTANDPFEYGEPVEQFTGLGPGSIALQSPVGGTAIIESGTLPMNEQECPVYDYTPIYDPLHPALVAPPTAPEFYPDGWDFPEGVAFNRYWVRLSPTEPSALNFVPVLTLTPESTDVRMVRVRVWPGDAIPDSTCEPLWSAYVTYAPSGMGFVIDGEQKAAYAWDGVSPLVRRTDSLVYGDNATPLQWPSFNHPDGLLVTLDIKTTEAGAADLELALVPKSD